MLNQVKPVGISLGVEAKHALDKVIVREVVSFCPDIFPMSQI